MKPHEVVAHAALVVADPEAEMRRELEAAIAAIVEREVTRLLQDPSKPYAMNIVNSQQYNISQIALRAIKKHFNNPVFIPDY